MNKKQQKILKTLQEYDELNKQIKALYAERDLLEAWLLERLPVGTHLARTVQRKTSESSTTSITRT